MSKSGFFSRDGGVAFMSVSVISGGDGGLEAGGWLCFWFFFLVIRTNIYFGFFTTLVGTELRLAYHSSARM